MNIIYRNAAIQDEEGVFVLARSLATSYNVNKKEFSAIFADTLGNANADILIAECNTELIGYVLAFHHPAFYANGTISWVEEIFVAEPYRRMRAGQKLMEMVEKRAGERGSKLVALATRRAGDFYKSIGYAESAQYFKKTL
ncbi:GNAT family N-acetyltransferase [Paenibacillus ginsengarvi]|uniref:N-acetyltransferase n=1 Tax=Paenibacillus ginsengarvi TaxID=400777 RepID=A0A3B0CMN0_9BACL|nr:GNAT family N-acetyltransferase [Paenibacillus ginsengarvi]RKN85216.1 N-acetyltransferase [Paenibacillus ginsengarvi]